MALAHCDTGQTAGRRRPPVSRQRRGHHFTVTVQTKRGSDCKSFACAGIQRLLGTYWPFSSAFTRRSVSCAIDTRRWGDKANDCLWQRRQVNQRLLSNGRAFGGLEL